MQRSKVIEHLQSNGCYEIEEGRFEDGVFYQNLINFQIVYVPFEEEYDVYTWAGICYELDIIPPDGSEEHFERYREFRADIAGLGCPRPQDGD